jgi:hypothetical protein
MSITKEKWRWGARAGDLYGGGAPEWRERGAIEEQWLQDAISFGWAGLTGEYAGRVFALRDRARELASQRDC